MHSCTLSSSCHWLVDCGDRWLGSGASCLQLCPALLSCPWCHVGYIQIVVWSSSQQLGYPLSQRNLYRYGIGQIHDGLILLSFLSLQSWDIFFRNANAGAAPGTAYQSPPPLSASLSALTHAQALVQAQPNVDKLVEDHLAVQSLVRAYQVRGGSDERLVPLAWTWLRAVENQAWHCTVGFRSWAML